MVSVSVLAVALKPGEDNIWAVEADEANHILQKHLIVPFLQRFVQSFGIPEIDGTAEKEVNPVIAHRREMLLGSDDTECVKQFGADKVCAALTARG